MKGPTPRRLKRFACGPLRLAEYLKHPGDGRLRPQVPAHALLWALLIGQVLRECSFRAVEALVRSAARRNLEVARAFSDDTLGYFTERLDPEPARAALASVLKRAKRNKAFENRRFLGLALDGTATSMCAVPRCSLCRPLHDSARKLLGYRHELSLITLVGAGALSLPFDVEPYGPGDSEYSASQRLLQRAVAALGPRFADYVVADGEYATAPFLHCASGLGLWVVARLKDNLPLLLQAAQQRFRHQASRSFEHHGDHIELWDADDFDPWDTLRWTTVRVLRYLQHKPDGTMIEAYWLTNAPSSKVGSQALFHMAKSRWEVENQGFNEAKNHHGLEHLCHHHPNSLLLEWLLIVLALTLERLYRLRYLHRGLHVPHTAIELVRTLRLSLGAPRALNSS